MLRGAIDLATPTRLGGWVFCEGVSLRDHTVLAYLDDICIGTGRIDKFRQDLADAGLGDGLLGFNFAIGLEQPEDLARVVIRLDGSDAVILQSQGRIAAAALEPKAAVLPLPTHRLASVKWMREHGWLDQGEYDFLNCMQQFGVYDRMLRQPRAKAADPPAAASAATVASELLELYYMDTIELQRETLASVSDVASYLGPDNPKMTRPDPIVVLSAPERCRVGVAEGSQRDRPPHLIMPTKSVEASIEYVLGPDRLLFMNARCLFQAVGPAPIGGLELFHAG